MFQVSKAIRANTSSRTVTRLAASMHEALFEDLPRSAWRDIANAIARGELWVVENIAASLDAPRMRAWADRMVGVLGTSYQGAVNDELARVGSRARVELYQKAAKRTKNRFPGVPHSDEFIRERAGELVVQISAEQRRAVQEQLLARYTNERRPETLVRDLQKVVGLDPRRARALRTFEDKLRADKAKNIEGQVERYRDKLLQNRAETIARTESVTVENQARMEAWDMALDAGELPSDAEQEWVSTGEACPRCQELDGVRVPVGEAFPSSLGPALPPLHPNCYCTIVLRSF